MKKNKLGFTLIELLVVVLIIGVLAAIALPMYQKAVLKSRFAALMPIVKAMNDSNEAYYLEHNRYASNPQDLPVQGQSEYPTGTELEFGNNMDYAYVLASNPDARNNYIMYQKQSVNYPGEIHCEALNGDDDAQAVCLAYGTNNIGTILTSGYTTYVIEGSGMGFPPGYNALLAKADCTGAEALGFTCEQTVDEENNTVSKKICTELNGNNYCRTHTYNEDGSYTSLICQVNSERVCTTSWQFAEYDANGNKLSQRSCYSNMVSSTGDCTMYYPQGSDFYTYDENGNMLTHRKCDAMDSSGNCTQYSWYNSYDYTYDVNGNMLTQRRCASMDSSTRTCTSYESSDSYNYTYDANGNILTQRTCRSFDSSGNCTEYKSGTDYTYSESGDKVIRRTCNSSNSSMDINSGNCTRYVSIFFDMYDANGNMVSQRACTNVDSSGNCTRYQTSASIDYTYDANGNMLAKLQCENSSVNISTGNCTSYSGGWNYTYDANGNILSQRQCNGVDSNNGNCTAYSDTSGNSYDYIYDDNGKLISYQICSGSDLNTSTGECTAYDHIYVQAN